MKKIINHYDNEAKYWNKIMGSKRKFLKRYAPWIKLIKKNKNKTVLDAGCGSGIYGACLASLGFHVTFLDISKNMIKESRKNARPYKNVKFHVGKIEDYKSPKKFGAILASGSLHNMNLNSLKKSLSNLAGILEENGILIIEMRYGNFEGIRKGQFGKKLYYRYSNPTEIKKLLKPLGLKWKFTEYTTHLKNKYFLTVFSKN